MIFLIGCAIKLTLILSVTFLTVRVLRGHSAALRHCAGRRHSLCRDHSCSEFHDSGMDMDRDRRYAPASGRPGGSRSRCRFAVTSTVHPDASATVRSLGDSASCPHSGFIRITDTRHVSIHAERHRGSDSGLDRGFCNQLCGFAVWLWPAGMDPASLASFEL